jgi:hypothetical protein
VVELDEATRMQFKAKTTGVYEKWTDVIGAELVKKAETAVAASR